MAEELEYKKVAETINDFANDNLSKLAQLFPAAVKDGEVDFEALKQELGAFKEVGSEKYELTWAGKQNAKKVALEDVNGKTLNYVPEDSKNPETTENLYIEGDNLEVLKLLRQNYYGAIKMIYIDPPYNTGNDFVYNDNFTMSVEESEIAEGNRDELGERYQVNLKSQNRYHANWLSMMYPRLKIAKDLLKEDGVIFISIDDNEVGNLKKICDDVFSEENFINQISVKTKPTAGASGGGEDKKLKKNIEYVLCYVKNQVLFAKYNDVYEEQDLFELIEDMKTEGKSWKYTRVITSFGNKEFYKTIEDGKGEAITIYKHKDVEFKTITELSKVIVDSNDDITIEEAEKKVHFLYFNKIFRDTNAQSSIRQRVLDSTDSEDTFYSIEYVPQSGRNRGRLTTLYYKGRNKDLIAWLHDVAYIHEDKIVKREKLGTLWSNFNWNNISKEGSVKYSNGKKPVSLVEQMLELSTNSEGNDIILDFFSGSATTAHAVLNMNVKDGGKRSFIMVQYPERLEPNNTDSSNKKAVLELVEFLESIDKPAILSELGKERIRRAGDKIIEEKPELKGKLDIGFKVFKVADTNIKWNHQTEIDEQFTVDTAVYTPDLMDFMPGAKDEDIVYEVMLRQNDVPLSTTLETLTDIGQRTYLYASSYLVCLETEITVALVDKLAALNPLPFKFIFRDSAFQDDIALKDETFRRLKALIEKNAGTSKKTYTVEFI